MMAGPHRDMRQMTNSSVVRGYPGAPERDPNDGDNWRLHASCRTTDASAFFSPDGERGEARTRREKRAKHICGGCPVRLECRNFALNVGEPFGTWGGLSESDRRNRFRCRATPKSAITASARAVHVHTLPSGFVGQRSVSSAPALIPLHWSDPCDGGRVGPRRACTSMGTQ